MYVSSYAPYGAEGVIIRVEADLRRGIPGIDITGLAEGAVRESRERVMAAFRNSGYLFPPERILINLAPAGVRKEGAALDLAIALAVMAAAQLVPLPDNLMVMGELELSGRLRPVRGALAAAAAGIEAGIREFMAPAENAPEAAVLAESRVAAVSTLSEAAAALITWAKSGSLPAYQAPAAPEPGLRAQEEAGDFAEVRGQGRYKRALEIAASGGHNLLVFGPPGAGKTMLARRMAGIMAPLTTQEALEVTRLYSLAGIPRGGSALITSPPFRSPHHSASAEGILGGGRVITPGEISLAHCGVLFMDEAPEFGNRVLQSLREPLEDGVVTISRAEGKARLPADFQLFLAANTCPCGRLGARNSDGGSIGCLCAPEEIRRYWRKFSGALLDRIEVRVPVLAPDPSRMSESSEEPSAAVAARVAGAAAMQEERFKGAAIRRNARMTPGMIERFCSLTDEGRRALTLAAAKLGLSGRAFHSVLRTARTIADLDLAAGGSGSERINTAHILEAVQHRRLGEDPYDILSVSGAAP
ncbi:MAG: YifB family Mg chelatase-like AAA ATPase [Spirochaetaceae bacterium]|jgi:magnesium chelatase family protein|nr:YifB family Mg chelatase-like AAA ATPase [Spirochaetaceae bacterium]